MTAWDFGCEVLALRCAPAGVVGVPGSWGYRHMRVQVVRIQVAVVQLSSNQTLIKLVISRQACWLTMMLCCSRTVGFQVLSSEKRWDVAPVMFSLKATLMSTQILGLVVNGSESG